jgi:hypothetical protein
MVRSKARLQSAGMGALGALPFVPGAIGVGITGAEKLTGWSFKKESEQMASVAVSRLRSQQHRELYGRGGRYRGTFVERGEESVQRFLGGRGAKVKEQMDKLLQFMAMPGLQAGDFQVDPAQMAKLTTDDINLLTSKLGAFQSVLSDVAVAGMDLPGGTIAPPAATRRGLISEAAPVLDMLRKIEKAIIAQRTPTIAWIDPNKTAKGVTNSRKGKKK